MHIQKSTRVPFTVLATAIALLAGCNSTHTARYTFVYLKTGPESAKKSPEESREIFKGHMSNMQRLAAERKLIVAGPFDHPHDPSWRGIFIFDVPSVADARKLVETDPGVQAGVFTPELRAFHSQPALRRVPEFDEALKAHTTLPARGAPPNIRGFVMITARDFRGTNQLVQGTPFKDRVLWSGEFTDPPGGGVILLDEPEVAKVQEALGSEAERGGFVIDGWYSTTALLKLRK
jgi:uncharacterized protein YciI